MTELMASEEEETVYTHAPPASCDRRPLYSKRPSPDASLPSPNPQWTIAAGHKAVQTAKPYTTQELVNM